MIITKTFQLIYGHRIWNQRHSPCRCRHIHGHNAEIHIRIGSNGLDHGMVLDFGELSGWWEPYKELLDHKLILDRNDPLLGYWSKLVDWDVVPVLGFHRVEVQSDDPVLREWMNGVVLTDREPTAECLAEILLDEINLKCKDGIWCDGVVWRETLSGWAEVKGPVVIPSEWSKDGML